MHVHRLLSTLQATSRHFALTALVTPHTRYASPIVLRSWRRSVGFGSFHSPHAHRAQPSSTQIHPFTHSTPTQSTPSNIGWTDWLPQTLILPECWNQPVDQLNLPDSLTELRFGDRFNQPVAALRLPSSLRSLHFGRPFNAADFRRLRLPTSLTQLTIGAHYSSSFNQRRIPQLPHGLRILDLGKVFNHPIDHWRLPDTIEQLILGQGFNYELDEFHFPASLTTFTFPPQYNHPVDEVDFTHCYQLTTIKFEADDRVHRYHDHPFNHPIDDMKLPASLTRLDLFNATSFNQPIAKLQLPPRLRFLS